MSTVMVTGGTGFIGAYLTRRLARAGRRVVALDPAPSNVLQEILTPGNSTIQRFSARSASVPNILSSAGSSR
jgi:nucleoside-diphosphate-sugar epimerase